MANCLSYNCDDQFGNHELTPCESYPMGGISGIVLFTCDTQLTDPESGTAIQAEIDAGRAVLINRVKANLPDASEVTVPSPVACEADITANYDNVLEVKDGHVNANNISVIYNVLRTGNSIGSILFYECDADRTTYINPPGGIKQSITRNVPEENTTNQLITATYRWRDRELSEIFAKPAGIFD